MGYPSSSLFAPLLAVAAAAGGVVRGMPSDHAAVVRAAASLPDCTANSFGDFAWTITGFQYNGSYIFSTPAHQVDNGVVSFNVTNPALPYPAVCLATSTQLEDFFYGNVVYNCTVPDEQEAAANGPTHTTFSFSVPTRELDVNQTWICPEGSDPTGPDGFQYAGRVTLPLTCAETNYSNPDWQVGEIYSSREVTCDTSGPVTVVPYQEEAEA
ncbi:hypothetical protein SPI_02128 [Niveomyces insectorum RCEF 264]|uniref:AA1-like domain-containing protein n=1 Tax=Niveomyces insectorum RCEF 264 TaxID=1081102 RepID=A0A167XSP3_9HYPO|nr:hypothetical protein SPI_02128 [Niveomyces insectorum RCEF 264]